MVSAEVASASAASVPAAETSAVPVGASVATASFSAPTVGSVGTGEFVGTSVGDCVGLAISTIDHGCGSVVAGKPGAAPASAGVMPSAAHAMRVNITRPASSAAAIPATATLLVDEECDF